MEEKQGVEANKEDMAKEEKETNALAEEYYAQLQKVMKEFTNYRKDFANYRKRVEKDEEALYNLISAELITEFLPVLDTLEKSAFTVEADDEKSKAWKDGIEMVCKQFKDVLKKLGAEEIKAVGETFDPNLHDAVMHVEDEKLGENIISKELRKGYKLNDRIIRHSMVVVAN